MGIMRTFRKPFNYVFANVALIIIGTNIAVFVLTQMYPRMAVYLGLSVVGVAHYHWIWQFFTYMFVHGGMTHLLFNMLGLFFFGTAVERALGSKEFLVLYVLSGTVCGLISFFVYSAAGVNVLLVGASGAIYAVLLSYAVVYPRSNIYIWGILPVPAPILVAVYAGIEIFSQLTNARSGIAHMTHLAGFAFAWIYFMVRMGINPWKVWKQNYF